eukprot:221170-Amphidinium_carterae.1
MGRLISPKTEELQRQMHYDKAFKSDDVKQDHPQKDDVKPSDEVFNIGESKPASSGTHNQTTPSKPAS